MNDIITKKALEILGKFFSDYTPEEQIDYLKSTLTEIYQHGREDEAIDHQKDLEAIRNDTLREVVEKLEQLPQGYGIPGAITLVTELLGSDKQTEV